MCDHIPNQLHVVKAVVILPVIFWVQKLSAASKGRLCIQTVYRLGVSAAVIGQLHVNREQLAD